MNRKLKHTLRQGFEAPAPRKKDLFLRGIQAPPIRIPEFIWVQAAYIRSWVWVLSALLFAAALIGAGFLSRNMLWHICAFMPLLALALITESGRSELFGMAELELSTRFSLKSLVLARLAILGAADFILFCLLIPLAFMNSGTGLLQTGVYMLCPYLLTAFLGLWAIRKVHEKEAVYLCVGIAVGVSFLSLSLCRAPTVFAEQNFPWWIAALALLGIGTAGQCRQMIKQTEELLWNL